MSKLKPFTGTGTKRRVDEAGQEMMTIDEIARYDRRRVAIHEAGHLTVACAKGVDGCALIFPNPTNDPDVTNTWIGRVEGFSAAPPAVAIAGLVADSLVEFGEDDEDGIYNAVNNAVYFGEVSDTDLAHLPPVESKRFGKAIGEALRLIRRHHRFFWWAVTDLVDSHNIPDGLAADVFRQIEARHKHGQCLMCGYDLRASKERCQRCGTPITAQMAEQ